MLSRAVPRRGAAGGHVKKAARAGGMKEVNAMRRLKSVLDNRNTSVKECAAILGISEKSLYNKLTCVTDFTYGEYLKLKTLLPEYNIDFLLDDVSGV